MFDAASVRRRRGDVCLVRLPVAYTGPLVGAEGAVKVLSTGGSWGFSLRAPPPAIIGPPLSVASDAAAHHAMLACWQRPLAPRYGARYLGCDVAQRERPSHCQGQLILGCQERDFEGKKNGYDCGSSALALPPFDFFLEDIFVYF